MNKNTESTQLTCLIDILLKKYHDIIGKQCKSSNSIEKIVGDIVNYYADIINCMPGNVYWLDRNCIAVSCNKNVADMFGLKSILDFKGLTFEDMGRISQWTAEATHSFKCDTLEVINTGKPKINIEEPPILHSDGRVIHFLTTRVPLFDNKGIVIGVVGISIDITERKQMEKELLAAKECAEAALKAKEIAEFESREKSIVLKNILEELKEKRYYLTGKYSGVYLTNREAQCVICLPRGNTAKEIGKILNLSPRTVETNLNNIKRKLNCKTRSELINKAIECRFLEGIMPVV